MKALFQRLPHAKRFGLVLTFLLLSIPLICGVAAVYIAEIRSDLAEVAGSEVPLAEKSATVAIGGIGQAVLFERAVRLGVEPNRSEEAEKAYQATKQAYFGIGNELVETIVATKAQAKALLVNTRNDDTRAEALLMHDLLREMENDFNTFQATADLVFELLDNGEAVAAIELAATASPRNLKLRAQIEQILQDIENFTSIAVAEAAGREERALITLGVLLFLVFAVGTVAGVYSLRALGTDLMRRQIRETQLHQRASSDKLTALANRSHFRTLGEKALRAARSDNINTAMLFIDLDGFKQVNDTYGHATGDTVLKEIADRLKRSVREDDTVCRLGGDEFAVHLVDAHTAGEARNAARRIIDYLSLPYHVGTQEIVLGASVGIAMHPDDAGDIDTLLRRADQAMYAAKESGGNAVLLFSELMEATVQDSDVIQFAQTRPNGTTN